MRVEDGAEVGSRGRIAAAGFLVASGLLAGGVSNTVAHAAPAPDSVGADEGNGGNTESGQKDGPNSRPPASVGGERSTDAEPGEHKPDGRKPYHRKPGEWKPGGRPVDQQPHKPEEVKPVGGDPTDGEAGVGEGPVKPPGGPVREEPPTKEETEEPEDCWPWWPPGPEPEPSPPGAGGDGDQSGRPSGRPQMPTMHLSPLLRPENMPSQPDVIDAEAGVGVAASDTAVAPIALPIIVAPPVALPGGVAPRGLPTEPVPGSPRSSAAEPAAGRQAPPAEAAHNAGTPPASYRTGYTDYLRSAGISQVVALAAPGLAGMLILTGLGGLLGYRQAKAGHASTHRSELQDL